MAFVKGILLGWAGLWGTGGRQIWGTVSGLPLLVSASSSPEHSLSFRVGGSHPAGWGREGKGSDRPGRPAVSQREAWEVAKGTLGQRGSWIHRACQLPAPHFPFAFSERRNVPFIRPPSWHLAKLSKVQTEGTMTFPADPLSLSWHLDCETR